MAHGADTIEARVDARAAQAEVAQAEAAHLAAVAVDADDGEEVGRVLDQMPTGVLVVDPSGTVRYANRVVLERLGWSPDDAVGRSILDVVLPEDVEFAAEAIAKGPDFYGNILGPMRLRFHDADGRIRFTEFWARELDDRSGYVLVVPEESSTDTLADAAHAIAGGEPIDVALAHIAASFRVHPIAGEGCVLRVDEDELTPVGTWPLDPDLVRPVDRSAPWQLARRSGVGVDVEDVDTLEERLRAALAGRGYRAVWCRPVLNRRGDVNAVIVVLRRTSLPLSPNQRRRLDEIVGITALAFDQLEYRSTLERAAFIDPLTGAATRARLHQEVAAGISGAAVVYLDLDGFKQINDTYGHGAGDAVLIEVAGRLGSIVRRDDLVVRVGGDEFVLVIRDVSELDSVRIAARVVDELSVPYEVRVGDHGEPMVVSATASVGLCVQSTRTSFDLAIQAADEALCGAKRAGKRRMHVVSR